MVFLQNFFESMVNRKEPEPQFSISAPEGNLISAPQRCLLVALQFSI
jgi:hypothetical protein